MLPRRVQAELLDALPAADPLAERSRRDLQRVHRVLGTRGRLVRKLSALVPEPVGPLRILEVGAGDGSLLLGVARDLASSWPEVELTLLDRIALVDDATVTKFAQSGWTATSSVMDVLDWANACGRGPRGAATRWDVVVANLFLHHLDVGDLTRVFAAIAESSERFVAFEPRRGWPTIASSHLVGLLGVNSVTRVDAVLSVHAGFRGRELSALWPGAAHWRLQEGASGPFSHCFSAARRGTR